MMYGMRPQGMGRLRLPGIGRTLAGGQMPGGPPQMASTYRSGPEPFTGGGGGGGLFGGIGRWLSEHPDAVRIGLGAVGGVTDFLSQREAMKQRERELQFAREEAEKDREGRRRAAALAAGRPYP